MVDTVGAIVCKLLCSYESCANGNVWEGNDRIDGVHIPYSTATTVRTVADVQKARRHDQGLELCATSDHSLFVSYYCW